MNRQQAVWVKRWLVTAILFSLWGGVTMVARATTASDLQSKSINELRSQQANLAALLKQKQQAASQEKTVSKTAQDEINQLQSDIGSLQKQISDTSAHIQETSQNIDQLAAQIDQKQTDISAKIQQVQLTLRQFYKLQVSRDDLGYMAILFSNEGLSKQVQTKQSYASIKQEIQREQASLEKDKQDLQDQKMATENKKQTLQLYQQQQQVQKSTLALQQQRQAALKANADQAFAALTKEQQQIQQEEASIEAAINLKVQATIAAQRGLTFVQKAKAGTPVHQGDVIGLLGSTGFSTGPHVHFGVYTPEGATVNPMTRLGNQYIYPVSNYTISQGYGPANWRNSMYSFHNGVDLAGPVGQPVHAAADGAIVLDAPYGAFGCAVVIAHADGWYTLYGHMICK